MHDAEHDAREPELHGPLVDFLRGRRLQVVELDGMGLIARGLGQMREVGAQ